MKNVVAEELFDSLYLQSRDLTSGQQDFIESVKRQYKRTGTISEKQMACLADIKKHLHPIEPRYSMKKD